MKIEINGAGLDYSIESEKTLGEVLASLDAWLDDQGLIIRSLSVDGQDRSADVLALKDMGLSDIGTVALRVEPTAAYRLKAIGDVVAWFDGISARHEALGYAEAAAQGRQYLARYSGLLSAEESAGLEVVCQALDGASSGRAWDPAQVKGFAELFRLRLEELADPLARLERATSEYAALRPKTLDIPLMLQASREAEAMQTIMDFTKFFSSLLRLIPILSSSGHLSADKSPDGGEAKDFYADFNRVLRDLNKAFQDGDTVSIGDLVEYEVVPRMDSLMASLSVSAAS